MNNQTARSYRLWSVTLLCVCLILVGLSACGEVTATAALYATTTAPKTATPLPAMPTTGSTQSAVTTPAINTSTLPIPECMRDITTELPVEYVSDLKNPYLPKRGATLYDFRVYVNDPTCEAFISYHQQLIASGWQFVLENGSDQPVVSSGLTTHGIYAGSAVMLETNGVFVDNRPESPIYFYRSLLPTYVEAVRRVLRNTNSVLSVAYGTSFSTAP